ncbi:VOC family protein [Aestuariicella hydrocarbonica]|uniref:VOC family protein n=2 Tax=Pseudomaricurvus hydrocarbonicus TaxID=1470433 RepID=A0A9E5MMB5_9GAMM|nr:VOC family protein [Aestuariicella hydrocarbonica]
MQNSWVVNDLQQAMRFWTRTAGIGPFFHVQGVTIEEQLYRGMPTQVEAEFALAQAGDIQIELVCQLNDAPSAYRDTIPKGQEGFHHMALYCDDYDVDLASYTKTGTKVAFSGSVGGKRFCYLDTSATLGCMIELIEASSSQAEFFQRIQREASEWDGNNPIRPAF